MGVAVEFEDDDEEEEDERDEVVEVSLGERRGGGEEGHRHQRGGLDQRGCGRY